MTAGGINAEDSCLNNHPAHDPGHVLQSCSDLDHLPLEDSEVDLEKVILQHDIELGRAAGAPIDIDSPTTPSSSAGPVLVHDGTSSPSDAALEFPEGGIEAWLVVLGSFCAMTAVFGLSNSAAVYESYLAENQLVDYTPFQIGWIFSVNLFLVFFVGIQVGPVFDRYGPRVLVLVGSILSCASLFLFSIATEYYQIMLTYSVLGGLGGALLNAPSYGCIAHYFNKRRGLATGIATTSGGIGGIVFPILLQYLLPTLGFAWSTRILGFIFVILAVPANLFIRARLPPVRPDADGSSRFASLLPEFLVFRDPRFVLTALGGIFMECGLFVPLTYIVSYASAHGQDSTASYVLLSYLNAGSVVGRVLPGYLADKFGRFNVIILTIALCVISVLGLWLPAGSSRPILIAYSVLFGFASGSNLGLIPVCFGQLCDPREIGRTLSTAMMVASIGTLSSVPIGGALLQTGPNESGWTGLILFAGLAYAVALVCYISARILAVGPSLRVKF